MTEKCYPEVTGVIFGRWFRVCLGITGKDKPIVRKGTTFKSGFFAVRLWPTKDSWPGQWWRIIIFQNRSAESYDKRLRFRT